jgi:hypothetical protein
MKIAEIMGVSLESLPEDELKQMQVNYTNIQCHNQDCTNNYQIDKEVFAEILKAKDETIATQKEPLSTLKEIRLLAKVLFLIPQPCPSPNGEGLKILSQEVYYGKKLKITHLPQTSTLPIL